MAGWRAPLAATVVASMAVSAVAAQDRKEALAFIGVNQDEETRKADQRLTERLQQRAGVRFAPEELEYEAVIQRLVHWKKSEGAFVARATPYVYLVAEMLGADIEPLATYVSTDKAASTTYHSYLIVNRTPFTSEPSLDDVVHFLRTRAAKPRFVYHNQFSTSSYLLPLLFFRSHDMFHMEQSREGLTAIQSDQIAGGSSKLAAMVASGEADIAAVWDNTKSKIETQDPAVNGKVYFIPIPTPIPNDLLVCPRSIDSKARASLLRAIDEMEKQPREIGIGDFATWQNIAAADAARHALADLRWDARERPPAVTVEIEAPTTELAEAGHQAVRLAGTEFVLYDPDFHKRRDFIWALEPIHDGAVRLTSTITGYTESDDRRPATQEFRLSFHDADDLTNRLVGIIQSRLHRIRYVWGFSNKAPIVFRDIPFTLAAGAVVKVQTYQWVNPDQNELVVGNFFNAKVTSANRYRFELEPQDFMAATHKPPELDPMSNIGYRVILVRDEQERSLFRALTIVLQLLFVLAAAAAIWDAVRDARRPATKPTIPGGIS